MNINRYGPRERPCDWPRGQFADLDRFRAPMERRGAVAAVADLGLEGDRTRAAARRARCCSLTRKHLTLWACARRGQGKHHDERNCAEHAGSRDTAPSWRPRSFSDQAVRAVQSHGRPTSGLQQALEGQRGMLAKVLEGRRNQSRDSVQVAD